MTEPDRARLAAMLAGGDTGLARYRHALCAHELAAAETFTELIALGRMGGVERHGYQIETVQRVLRALRGRALLADEVGLGKTVEALMILVEYLARGMARRVLVLVPPTLVTQWIGELAAKAGIAARTPADDDADSRWRGDGVVVASLATARTLRNAAAVQAEPWDLVIVDEAHRIKRRGSASWKLVDGLRSRFLLLLTATPIENELEELYYLVTLLRPGQFATPAAFRREFVDPTDASSPKNREALRRLLGEVMVRNTRASCGLRLPPRYVSTVVVEPDPAERALYASITTLLRAATDAASRRIAEVLLLEAGSSPAAVAATIAGRDRAGSFAEVASASATIRDTRKGRAVVELVRAGGAAKVLVFTRYRATAEWLVEHLAATGLRAALVHGALCAADKQRALDAFRADAQILISTDVGSEGHNLQHCHRLINFDLPWNPMVIEQRIGRLHRYGQTEEVEVHNLCARGSMEERILAVLHDRVRLFELVVGEMDMVLGDLADEGDLEQRLLALCASTADDAELARGVVAIGDELLRARGRYDEVRALDQALFGQDFEA